MRKEKKMELAEKLRELGYQVSEYETAAEAAEALDKELDGKSIGFGGSATVSQMGLYEKLKAHNRVVWHGDIPAGKTAMDMRLLARNTEIYISSVNAVSEKGEIVNIDATGNRVSEISFGHKTVILLIGRNKVTKDLESAVLRARNIAAPQNTRRLGKKTPCAEKADRCYDCASADRLCRSLSILLYPPLGAEYRVVLINEDLGF